MASSLFQSLMGGMSSGPFSNMNDFFNRFNQFRQTYGSQNPQQVVQNMIKNGQMSQEDFNRFAEMANKIRPMMK